RNRDLRGFLVVRRELHLRRYDLVDVVELPLIGRVNLLLGGHRRLRRAVGDRIELRDGVVHRLLLLGEGLGKLRRRLHPAVHDLLPGVGFPLRLRGRACRGARHQRVELLLLRRRPRRRLLVLLLPRLLQGEQVFLRQRRAQLLVFALILRERLVHLLSRGGLLAVGLDLLLRLLDPALVLRVGGRVRLRHLVLHGLDRGGDGVVGGGQRAEGGGLDPRVLHRFRLGVSL